MAIDLGINERVSVYITSYIASGLLGLVDEKKAIIRNRELAWGSPLPLSQYIGQTKEAVVIGLNADYDEIELSLRLAQRDPWEYVSDKYPIGSVVEGRIIGLTDRAAFAELEPGVTGFLHISEVLPQRIEHIEDHLWIQDLVKAAVTDINPVRRHVRISVRDILLKRETSLERELWKDHSPRTTYPNPIAAMVSKQVSQELFKIGRPAVIQKPVQTLHVLVVEDDHLYGSAVEHLLSLNGCKVTSVTNSPAALSEILNRSKPFDLILIDWGLPGPKGHELVEILQQEECPSRLAMVLEPAPFNDRPEVLRMLRAMGITIFSKSDAESCTDGIIALLDELRTKEPSQCNVHQNLPQLSVSNASRESNANLVSPLPEDSGGLDSILRRLSRTTRSKTVLVVHFDPGPQKILVDGAWGKPFPFDQAGPEVIHSPLRDVLEENVEVWERNATDSVRFKKLTEVSSFQGFLGIPVPGFELSHYGLFLLRERGSFRQQDRQVAQIASFLIAQALQERRLIHALQPWQAQQQAGQLVSSVIHEINNKLGSISHQTRVLKDLLVELSHSSKKAEEPVFLFELEDAVNEIAEAQIEAGKLRDQYLGLTVVDEPQKVDLINLSSQMVDLLRTEARHNNILLDLKVPTDLPAIFARPSQIRAIILNLVLNALQHMVQWKIQGRVIIEIRFHHDSSLPIQLLITDEGPGIHKELWERVFDFGFTTKKRGAGLGLTISRQIAKSLGGNLKVEHSYALLGTAFLLQLPVGDQNE